MKSTPPVIGVKLYVHPHSSLIFTQIESFVSKLQYVLVMFFSSYFSFVCLCVQGLLQDRGYSNLVFVTYLPYCPPPPTPSNIIPSPPSPSTLALPLPTFISICIHLNPQYGLQGCWPDILFPSSFLLPYSPLPLPHLIFLSFLPLIVYPPSNRTPNNVFILALIKTWRLGAERSPFLRIVTHTFFLYFPIFFQA